MISYSKARLAIFLVFGVALAVELAAVLTLGVTNALSSPYRIKLVVQLLRIYSVPGSLIAAGVFAAQRTRKPVSPGIYWLALASCCVWNSLLAFPCAQFAWPPYSPSSTAFPALLEWLDSVSAWGSFLITGALALFFTKAG
jgi:hypothetical protein